jgi:hypothetical protein
MTASRRVDRETIRRECRRNAAAARWGEGDAATRQRTAMVIAAFLLDEAQENAMADWLLCADPEHARAVATAVAVHALRYGLGCVWDALVAVDAMDHVQATEWFEGEGDFVWSPGPGMLIA